MVSLNDLFPLLPVFILLIILVNELKSLFKQGSFSVKYSNRDKGIVFIPEFNLWLSMFKTNSAAKIQFDELEQLEHLGTFSLELNLNDSTVNILFYSKSHTELINRMENCLVILDTLFPDVTRVNQEIIDEYLKDRNILEIEGKFLVKEDGNFIVPRADRNGGQGIQPRSSVTVFNKTTNMYQNYYLYSYPATKLFWLLDVIASNPHEPFFDNFGQSDAQRVLLRYLIKDKPIISLTDAFQCIKNEIRQIKNTIQSINQQETDISSLAIDTSFKVLNSIFAEQKPSQGMNQVCSELCSIPRATDLSIKEKILECQKLSKICDETVKDGFLYATIENILSEQDDFARFSQFKEIIQMYPSNKIICLLARLRHNSGAPSISDTELISLIHLFLKSQTPFIESELSVNHSNHKKTADMISYPTTS